MTPMKPRNFSIDNADVDGYELNLTRDKVYIYRFGNRDNSNDWLSRMRQTQQGNFATPNQGTLNELALLQTSYGSSSGRIDEVPFLSVATSYEKLYSNGEIWVQEILKSVPHLGKFSVPFHVLFRPSPTKLISKMETEWLYYDGDDKIDHYLEEWIPNPYKK